jgi:hypothetical protein
VWRFAQNDNTTTFLVAKSKYYCVSRLRNRGTTIWADKAELREEAEMRQPAHVMLHRSADEVRQSAGRHDSLVDRFA